MTPRGRRNEGTDVLEDFDPAKLVAAANAKQAAATVTPAQAEVPAQAPAKTTKAKRRPKVDPWARVAFNSKVPRWIRSATRAFADKEEQDLQDLHAAALLLLMTERGFDFTMYAPDLEVSPTPPREKKLGQLLDSVLHGIEPDEQETKGPAEQP